MCVFERDFARDVTHKRVSDADVVVLLRTKIYKKNSSCQKRRETVNVTSTVTDHMTWGGSALLLELKVKFRVHGSGTSATSDTYPNLRHATRKAMTHNAKLCQCCSEKCIL